MKIQEQTAQELKKGCGKNYSKLEDGFKYCNKYDLCPECKRAISQQLQSWNDEVEFFISLKIIGSSEMRERISSLKRGIKELEEKEE